MFSTFKRRLLRQSRQLQEISPHWLRMTWDVITAPGRWLGQSLGFAGRLTLDWWTSRRWRRLLWGLPTIAVMVLCAYYMIRTTAKTTPELARQYVLAGRSASTSGQWPAATLYLERAIELGVRDRETLFDLAIAADKSGDESRKVAVLHRLAPDDQAIFAPAHLWRAMQTLSVSPVPLPQLAIAEQQLRFALQLEPENANAHGILGDMYFQRGFMEGAATHLAKASKSVIGYQLLHAKACVLTKRRFEAESSAKMALQLASVAVGENPNNLEVRLQLGEAQLILEQFENAVATLTEGMRVSPDEPKLHSALARVYLEWARAVLDKPGDPEVNRIQAFQLTAAAMQQNPDDYRVFDQMMALVELNDDAALQAREFLLNNIALGRAVGISHLLLGTSLDTIGDQKESGYHLEQAFKLMPEAPVVANNLAWHLVYQDPPEIDRAMKLISLVIDKHPNVPAYIDTRGHVYLKMKEWRKAIDDFEISLRQFANEPSVHAGLAEAYENLQMTELATRHRAISEKLLAQAGKLPIAAQPATTPP